MLYNIEKILSHHSGHVIFERVLPFLSDFELLELEKELGEREDLLEGLNAALPSIVWRLRAKRDPKELRVTNDFKNYCAAVRENLEQRALTWNDIDFN
ncbi:Oidioi.mRNA.OKI2018_I69.chr2.g4472.t1.cds [Oikopleura dioica]|uniref:Oidioi.mRNA.OKI2018_I69.chr2.g4472.t1.cds n=1 Tax=Oikopleura dioica TaxID=34765 RepID=A0ABN7T1Q2_OIKDI|nr:Oidioi.mRNA.OKI2018_I69.chr2.g4472.t1.cds [Oikopleura dioica]